MNFSGGEKNFKGMEYIFPFLLNKSKYHLDYIRSLARARAAKLDKGLESNASKHASTNDKFQDPSNSATSTRSSKIQKGISQGESGNVVSSNQEYEVNVDANVEEFHKVEEPRVEHITPEEAMKEIEYSHP